MCRAAPAPARAPRARRPREPRAKRCSAKAPRVPSPRPLRPALAYKRYFFTEDGISPLAFPGRDGAMVKANSYTHDEFGITTEDPELTVRMQDKWNAQGRALADELDTLPQVNVYGDPERRGRVVTWGSPTGAVREVGELAGIRIVQPVVLWPFPDRQTGGGPRGQRDAWSWLRCNSTRSARPA